MMNAIHLILAAKEEDSFMKVIFFLIFGAIWVLSAIISAIGKKKQKERNQRVREELERAQRTAPDWERIANQAPPPPVPRPASRNLPLPPPPPPRIPPRVPKERQAQQTRPPPRPPKLPKQPKKRKREAEFVEVTLDPEPPRPPLRGDREAARPAQKKVGASDLRAWLRPTTLRDQFILTEILQPPLSMRPPRD